MKAQMRNKHVAVGSHQQFSDLVAVPYFRCLHSFFFVGFPKSAFCRVRVDGCNLTLLGRGDGCHWGTGTFIRPHPHVLFEELQRLTSFEDRESLGALCVILLFIFFTIPDHQVNYDRRHKRSILCSFLKFYRNLISCDFPLNGPSKFVPNFNR